MYMYIHILDNITMKSAIDYCYYSPIVKQECLYAGEIIASKVLGNLKGRKKNF